MCRMKRLGASVRLRVGAILVALAGLVWTAQLAIADSAAPPGPDFQNTAMLQVIEVELQMGNPAQAGQRVAALLQDHAHQTLRGDDGRLQSVAQWARAWLAAHPQALAGYREAADRRAAEAMRKVQQDPTHRHEALYAIVSRYPMSGMEGRLLLAAAQRAVAMGDPVAAGTYLDAIRDSHNAREVIDQPDAQALADAIQRIARDQSGRPIAFAADWFPAEFGFFLNRSLPHAAGGMTFIPGAWHMLAIDAEGRIAWSWADPDAQPELRDMISRSGRGLIHEPAVIADITGTPRVVVVRQVKAGDHQLVLRAFAATDGRLMWSTAELPELASVQFLGNPSACGGSIYVTGLTETRLGARLILLCLDAASGREIWRTDVGQVMHQQLPAANTSRRGGSDQSFDPQPFWQQSPPAVQGRTVIVAPNHGAVLAVDRFSGEMLWARAYTPTNTPDASAWRKYGPRGRGKPPIPVSQLIRYRSTPHLADEVVVCTPADSAAVFAFDVRTGRQLWSAESEEASVLIGSDGQIVVLAGAQIAGWDLRTGAMRWIHPPAESNPPCGPPAVYQGVVFVPTKRTMLALSVTDGRRVDRPPDLPRIGRFVALQGVKQILEAAGLTAAFAVAPLDAEQ